MGGKRRRERPEAAATGPAPENPENDGPIRREIELRAYDRYCERGCAPGGDVEDWLAAEHDVLAEHRGRQSSRPG